MHRRIPLFLLALVLAVAGVAAVGAYARSADARALAGQQAERVLVATAAVKAASTIDQVKKSLTTKELPKSAIPDGALSTLTGLDKKVTATALVPGQVLVDGMFVDGTTGEAAPPLSIPDGQMAVSIALEDPMHVSSFVVPGTDVAVFDTFNAFEGNAAGSKTPSGDGISDNFKYDRATRLLLKRARVLAIGTSKLGDKPSGTASSGQNNQLSVTLSVSQQDAERLILAAQTGHLYLALLNDKSNTSPSNGVDNRKLFG